MTQALIGPFGEARLSTPATKIGSMLFASFRQCHGYLARMMRVVKKNMRK